MKLRTKLVLLFLLLSVVPLAGIVLFSYYTSIRAVRQAAIEETAAAADDMSQRVALVRKDIGQRLQRLGDLPLGVLAASEGDGRDELLADLISSQMGDAASYLDSLEFIPVPPPGPLPAELPAVAVRDLPPGAHPAHPARIAPGAPAPPAPPTATATVTVTDTAAAAPVAAGPGAPSSFVIYLEPLRAAARIAARAGGEELATQVEAGLRQGLGEASAYLSQLAAEDPEKASELRALAAKLSEAAAGAPIDWAQVLPEVARGLRGLDRDRARQATEGVWLAVQAAAAQAAKAAQADSESRRWKIELVKESQQLEVQEQAEMASSRAEDGRVLGGEVDCPVEQAGAQVGRLRARLRSHSVLQAVLARTRREAGEIPFAVDRDGELYVARPADRDLLAGLPLSEEPVGTGVDMEDLKNWVLVRVSDPESGMVLGIARPIRESLVEIRRTAGSNFGYGLGLVAIALVGIVPLSNRLTRNLGSLTAGAERLAAGELDTQVDVHTRDEVGALAGAFNRMARDLAEQQRRLLEEARMRREQEVERSLLEAENRRRGEELEEARRFQLSLLPAGVPEHPELDLAVRMRTATEVGGDYYDFQQGADGALTVAIGDATGHGAKAGTMVTVIKSLFTAGAGGDDLPAFLARSTRTVKGMSLGRMAMALTLLRLQGGRMSIAAAGMPPALVHRAQLGRCEEISLSGTPLGALADATYDERSLDLDAGDTVILMSDGFPELLNAAGEPLGYARARSLFEQRAGATPEAIIDHLFRAAEAWAGSATPSDDITFLVLRYKGPSRA